MYFAFEIFEHTLERVMVGDDHEEVFHDSRVPPFTTSVSGKHPGWYKVGFSRTVPLEGVALHNGTVQRLQATG